MLDRFLLYGTTPLSGLMVALFLIVLLMSLRLVRGFSLASLTTAGVVVGGVMLIMYGLMVVFSLVGTIVLSICSEG